MSGRLQSIFHSATGLGAQRRKPKADKTLYWMQRHALARAPIDCRECAATCGDGPAGV